MQILTKCILGHWGKKGEDFENPGRDFCIFFSGSKFDIKLAVRKSQKVIRWNTVGLFSRLETCNHW